MEKFLAKKHQKFKVTHNMRFINKDGLIDLSIGDSDIHTDSIVIDKTFEDVKRGHTHYANPYGILELREKLCKTSYEDHQIQYSVDECLVTTSGSHALWSTLHAIIDPGDEVIILEPYYPLYPSQIKSVGGVPVCVKLDGSTGFNLDADLVEQKITPRTKAIIINSPNNPSGACYSKVELESLAKIVTKYNLVIISDEVYTNFCYDKEHIPFASIANMRSHTITIGSFSKNYVMTGWRIGFIFTDSKIVKIIRNLNESNIFTSPTISQRAAIHALDERKRIQQYLHHEFKKRIMYIYNELSEIKGLKPLKPLGAIYLFVDVTETGKTGAEFADLLLEKAHILVISGCSYGNSTNNYIRITASKNLDELKVAVNRIREFMQQLPAS